MLFRYQHGENGDNAAIIEHGNSFKNTVGTDIFAFSIFYQLSERRNLVFGNVHNLFTWYLILFINKVFSKVI